MKMKKGIKIIIAQAQRTQYRSALFDSSKNVVININDDEVTISK